MQTREGFCPWKREQMDKQPIFWDPCHMLHPRLNCSNSVRLINLLIVSATKDFQRWGLVPESLQIMRWVSPFPSPLCLNNIMHTVYSCALIRSWYFTPPGTSQWASWFQSPIIRHNLSKFHILKLITKFIYIHEPLVLKYQLVWRK